MGDRVFGRVSVAVVTPFVDSKVTEEQPIDLEGFRNVVTHNARQLSSAAQKYGLVGGVIVSGTTGEQHTLTVDEKCTLYATAVEVAKPMNVPIIAGIAETTTAAVKKLTHSALAAGVEGIMLGLPPYVRLDDTEVRNYIMAVKSLVPSDDFPILLYNNSFRNGYSPSANLLVDLCRSGVLWGIKHAPQPDDFKPNALALLSIEPSIRLYTGSDILSVEVLNHSDMAEGCPRFYGLTSMIGNLCPEQVALMVSNLTLSPALNGAETPSPARGVELHNQLKDVINAVLVGTSVPVGLKYAMRCSGISGGYSRQPVGHISAQKMSDIDRVIGGFTQAMGS